MIDVTKSTMEDLQAEFVRLAVILVDVENQRAAIDTAMRSRKRIVEAKVQIDVMNDQEKDALRDMLKVPVLSVQALV